MNSGSVLKPNAKKPHKNWTPAFYVPRKYKESDGRLVSDFAFNWLTLTKGMRSGEPLEFVDWQRWLIDSLLERRDDGRLRFRRALVGLPRKQGKSLLGSALALYGLFAGEAGAEVYSAAGDRQQARIVFNEAREQVMNSPTLLERCKVYRDAIEVPKFGAVYRVLSADGKLQQGLNPSLVIFDELHIQKNDELWDALTLGSGARKDPMVIGITTAGFDLDTIGGRLYNYGKSVASGEIQDDNFGFFWWEAPTDCNIFDQKSWAIANPNIKHKLLDLEDMEVSSRQTSEMAFRRYRLNQWVRSQESWLPVGSWDRCIGKVELKPDLPTFVGIDMALKHDSIGVVVVQEQEGKYFCQATIWFPDDFGIDVVAIETHLTDLHQKYNVIEFSFDPAYFQRSAEVLADNGLRMVEFPQSAQRMVPACGNAYELIVSGKVVHDGSPMFTDQVLSAAQRMTDSGWRLSKGKSRRKIDACIAMVMALDRATFRQEQLIQPSVLDIWT